MIFVTVGSQTPFDRLIRAVDQWAASHTTEPIVAQVGESDICPRHMQHQKFFTPQQFTQTVAAARVVVSHAGTGTIIAALTASRPLLVLPRRASLQETRNEHQLATARRFLGRGGIAVAFDEDELMVKLDHLDELVAGEGIAEGASAQLVTAVAKFIRGQ